LHAAPTLLLDGWYDHDPLARAHDPSPKPSNTAGCWRGAAN